MIQFFKFQIYKIENFQKCFSYSENIKIRSNYFQNQPMHPLDRAIFWIEKAMSNYGTKHLSLANFHLNFFQIYMIDVVVFISVICLMFLFVIKRHIHFGFGKSASKSTENVIKTEKVE